MAYKNLYRMVDESLGCLSEEHHIYDVLNYNNNQIYKF